MNNNIDNTPCRCEPPAEHHQLRPGEPLISNPEPLHHHHHHQSVLSAGYVFYSYPPNSTNVFFLLGMDSYRGKWSDFGGCKHKHETESMCAAREMAEETMGVVKFPDVGADLDTQSCAEYCEAVSTSIQNKQYTYRIAIDIASKQHTPLMVDQPTPIVGLINSDGEQLDPLLSNSLAVNHSPDAVLLTRVQMLDHLECNSISISDRDVLPLASTRMPIAESEHIDCKSTQKSTKIVSTVSSESSVSNSNGSLRPQCRSLIKRSVDNSSPSIPYLRVCYLKYIPWRPEMTDDFRRIYTYLIKFDRIHHSETRVLYYKTLPPHVQSHPGLLIMRDIDGMVVDVRSKHEWIEKQQVMWWSLPRLRYVLKNFGKYKRHIFRYGFLTTLSVIVDQFSRLEESEKSDESVCGEQDTMHNHVNLAVHMQMPDTCMIQNALSTIQMRNHTEQLSITPTINHDIVIENIFI